MKDVQLRLRLLFRLRNSHGVAAAALAGSLDAGRHLVLLLAATDLMVCFAAAWLARKMAQKTIRHTP
jgi:hypothetical protein